MKQYAVLCNDLKTGMMYYYDLEEQCLYQHDDSEYKKKNAKAGAAGGRCGGILGLLIYPFIGTFACNLSLNSMLMISILAGLLGALLFWRVGVYYADKMLSKEEKQYLGNDELLGIYRSGRKTRIKKKAIEIFLAALGVVADVYAWIAQDSFMFIMAMGLFWGVGILFSTYRPICTLKWKQQMRKNSRAQ